MKLLMERALGLVLGLALGPVLVLVLGPVLGPVLVLELVLVLVLVLVLELGPVLVQELDTHSAYLNYRLHHKRLKLLLIGLILISPTYSLKT